MNSSSSATPLIWGVYILSDYAVINFPIANIFGFNCFKYLRPFLLEDIPISGFYIRFPECFLTHDPLCPVAFSEVGSLAKWKAGFQKAWPATKAILTSGSTSFY